MNKHLIVLGIAVLLICVGLSGCNENEESKEVEIVNYEVTTNWHAGHGASWEGVCNL